ncbi:Acetate kinase [Cedecea neteri]|uniref:Acetate kinase n=1 Tax=Cedecea neteri TaxID=158822 RepID=A0A2X3IF49_9ENTR|nr:Acetate kinase [Cedecea neteri]
MAVWTPLSSPGGIGENAAMVRELSLGKLGVLGFDVDHERNLAARFGKSGFINKEGTRRRWLSPPTKSWSSLRMHPA